MVAQTNSYDIVLLNDVIGNGTSIQSKATDGLIKYVLKTKASAKILFKDHSSTSDIVMLYNGNTLNNCTLKREKDGVWQDVKITYENGKHYFAENGVKTPVAKPVTFTTTLLFFKEPKGVSEIYVERLNIFVPIYKEEEGLYKTTIDGGDNYYRYKNGVLVEFRLKKGINVYMNKV